MKTKNKILALLEIAIVLCSVFLVAIPAIAAEQTQTTQKASASEVTTASEDDYVLGVYGNANEDDTIDMRDLTYVKLIFFGKKPETELADAKYDGKINPLDFIQIKLIIVGKEKELTIVKYFGRPPDVTETTVTISTPIKRFVLLGSDQAQAIRAIGARDKVVGITSYMAQKQKFYPELSRLTVIGDWRNPDIEAILNVNPDIILCYQTVTPPEILEDKLEGTKISVVRLDCNKPDTLSRDMKTLGYIFDKKDEAEKFIEWYKGYVDEIKARTEELSKDKQRVLLLRYNRKFEYATITKRMPGHQFCTMAGGINIAADLPGKVPEVDPEWLLVQNPDVIVYAISSSKASCGYDADDPSELRDYRDKMMSEPMWSNIAAVKNERVYFLSSDLWSEPDYFVGVTYMAKWFHPETFEDFDPDAVNKEYLERFQGVPYRGVWVYPPF